MTYLKTEWMLQHYITIFQFIFIQVRAQKHCLQKHPTLTEEVTDSSTLLRAFKSSMSLSKLRNSADAAVLLVADLSGCGIAYTHTTSSCFTLSVTKKSCATGYYRYSHV